MVRTDHQYHADIRAVLEGFYRPGDMLYLVRHFKEWRKCQMYGGKADIWHCYELRNERSGERVVWGCDCIAQYVMVLRKMDQAPVILFPGKYREEADKINRRVPNTVILEPAGEGPLGAEEHDELEWNLCDCGVPLSYCQNCDNEVCPECERGCVCDMYEYVDEENWDEEGEIE